jgi:hypothetical protein
LWRPASLVIQSFAGVGICIHCRIQTAESWLGVHRVVSKVTRKGLTVGLVAVVLGLLALAASNCGESKAVAQPSFSPAAQPRLVDIGLFSLLSGRPTRVMLHATKSHPLRVFVLADRQLDSITRRHVADTDGSLVSPEAVPLQGSPRASGKQTV